MHTLHVISHTHWDREWYQTFQQFRLRLVHLVDKLLDILETNPRISQADQVDDWQVFGNRYGV